jgi:hypothetical protein
VKAEAGFDPLKTETRVCDGVPYRAEYTLILTDEHGNQVWLSGCNIGYGGTGPHGTYELLREVGLIPKDLPFGETAIGDRNHVWERP